MRPLALLLTVLLLSYIFISATTLSTPLIPLTPLLNTLLPLNSTLHQSHSHSHSRFDRHLLARTESENGPAGGGGYGAGINGCGAYYYMAYDVIGVASLKTCEPNDPNGNTSCVCNTLEKMSAGCAVCLMGRTSPTPAKIAIERYQSCGLVPTNPTSLDDCAANCNEDSKAISDYLISVCANTSVSPQCVCQAMGGVKNFGWIDCYAVVNGSASFTLGTLSSLCYELGFLTPNLDPNDNNLINVTMSFVPAPGVVSTTVVAIPASLMSAAGMTWQGREGAIPTRLSSGSSRNRVTSGLLEVAISALAASVARRFHPVL